MMQIHIKKTIQPYYQEVYAEVKTAEVRKDDCGYMVGDLLILALYDDENKVLPGGYVVRRITNLCSYQQKQGFVVLSMKKFQLSDMERCMVRCIYNLYREQFEL